MKLLFFRYATLCCVMVATALFSSCSEDSDNNDGGDDSKKAVEASVTYQVKFAEDILTYCNVKVAYFDEDGTAKAENITADWSKTMVCKTFPVRTILSYVITLKDRVDIDKEVLSIGSGCSISYSAYNAKGEVVGARNESCLVGTKQTSKDLFISGFSGEGRTYKTYMEIYEDGSYRNQ